MLPSVLLSNGERIAYRKEGRGEKTLVMLHGNMCSSLHFQGILPYLREQFTIYMPDMRGSGGSSYRTPISTIRDLSEDMREFMDLLELKDIILLGWSTGGCVGMQLASDYPQRWKALILIETIGYQGYSIFNRRGEPYADSETMRRESSQIATILKGIEQKDLALINRLWERVMYINRKPKESTSYVEVSLMQRSLPEVCFALANFNLSRKDNGYCNGVGEVERIRGPVLLTWGEDDKIVTRKEVFDTARALRAESNFYVLDRCGHFPFVDCPGYISILIHDFLMKYRIK